MWDLIVSVPDHCLSFYSALFTTDNIRKFTERAISPVFILLYHCYFPCNYLTAVALGFIYRRLLNPLLETLPKVLDKQFQSLAESTSC